MTQTSKHTPGPWRVEESTTLIWGRCDPDDKTTYGMGIPVAEVRLGSTRWNGPTIGWNEAEANARLIAAAPEMLEALAKMVCEYDAWSGFNDDGFEDETISEARAALAKARGEV